jgi:hypothetical protein
MCGAVFHAKNGGPPVVTAAGPVNLALGRASHDPVFLTRRGRRVAAVIDADDLQHLLEAAEDLADIEAAHAARAEIAANHQVRPPVHAVGQGGCGSAVVDSSEALRSC